MFPDSALLVLAGLIIGIFLKEINVDSSQYFLDSEVFFIYILPPLAFDAGYNMPARSFFDNFGVCVAFAFVITGFNVVAIGFSLWAIGLTGLFSLPVGFLDLMMFGALISDVDPVAVIGTFEELHVNDLLYITMFGESVLNDGAAVMIYKMVESYFEIGSDNIISRDYIFGAISFFAIIFGGVLLGIIFAAFTSFLTKFTDNVNIVNPIMAFILPFCSYWIAEMIGFSSILAIVFCGVILKPYIRENINKDSYKAIHYITKILAYGAEAVIFVFLGLSTVSTDHYWDTPFVCLTLIFCLIYRAVATIILAELFNKFQLKQFSKVDIFIIMFGGMRGAISYGLVISLPDDVPAKSMYVSATIVQIYFTVFLQGLVIRPIARFLEVERKHTHTRTMIETCYDNLIDNSMAGMEIIAGKYGHNWLRSKWDLFNSAILHKIFIKKSARKAMDKSNLLRSADKIMHKEALHFAEHIEKWYDQLDSLLTTAQNNKNITIATRKLPSLLNPDGKKNRVKSLIDL
uniref:Sodium/hydrogen exchanger n=1 Tax=Acrobeloides nanus TaxID=290746 RepID=A0A914C709_9BILA